MAIQIKTASVSQAQKLAFAKGIIKLKIYRPLTIVCSFITMHFEFVNFGFGQSNICQEFINIIDPVIKLFFPGSWIYKIFNFHLLKFTRPKCKIARTDFVSKSFANLGNAKWNIRRKCIN